MQRVKHLKEETYARFRAWRKELAELYAQANQEYDRIKKEKPLGPDRKDAL
jgi:hypothetical protein